MNKAVAATEANPAFTCVYETDRLPPPDPQADEWFKQACAMQKGDDEKDYNVIANLYRRAAENNHYNAMINLQNMPYQQQADPVYGKTRPEEVIAIAEKMVQLNIPAGDYAMGHYLDVGYGVKRDKGASLAYFRKTVDVGSIDAEIDRNPSAHFPDIDKIAPLLPAELPKWDGTFEYKKITGLQ